MRSRGTRRPCCTASAISIANAANLASLIWHTLPDLNWAGFYFLKDGQLVLGPFQGKPACVRIDVGKGVCGTAAARLASVIVTDVEAFPGHIACDSASRSELVVPILEADALSACSISIRRSSRASTSRIAPAANASRRCS